MNKTKFLSWMYMLYIYSLLLACNDKPVDREKLKEELKNRTLLRLTDGQISELALTFGTRLIGQNDSLFMYHIQSKADANCGVFFQLRQKLTQDSLKVSCRLLTPNDTAKNLLLKRLFDAYQNEHTGNYPINFQVINADSFLITKPLYFTKSRCSKCHSSKFSSADTVFAGLWGIFENKKYVIKGQIK